MAEAEERIPILEETEEAEAEREQEKDEKKRKDGGKKDGLMKEPVSEKESRRRPEE